MAKPSTVASSDTFATWRAAFNTLLGQAPEVVESPSSNPPSNSTGYEDGTLWIRQDTNIAWILVHTDAAAAVWTQLGATPGALKDDGTVPLAANWDAGSYYIQALRFISDVTTGTAPLTVSSTTLCSNLNADLLDGLQATDLNSILWTQDTADSDQSVAAGDKKIVSGLTTARSRNLPATFATTDRDIVIINSSGFGINVVPNTGDNIVSNGIDLGASNSMGLSPGTAVRLIPSVANATWVAITSGNPYYIPHTSIEQFTAYTLFMNNTAGTAGPTDTKISSLTEEATPASGDWLLGEESGGALRKFNVANIAPQADSISNTQLANMAAYTIKLRNAGTTGDPGDVKISALTTEAAPTAGDYLLMEESGGALRKVDFGWFGSIATKDYWAGTQAAYDGIGTPDANTIYFITG